MFQRNHLYELIKFKYSNCFVSTVKGPSHDIMLNLEFCIASLQSDKSDLSVCYSGNKKRQHGNQIVPNVKKKSDW